METYFYDKFKYLTVLGACKQGKDTWAVDRYTNCLYRLNEKRRELQFVANLEVNCEYVEAEYTHIVEYNGALFILPQNSYFICVYNTCSGKLTKLELPCKKDCSGYGVIGEIIYERYLYIFSCYEKYAPCKIDLTNLEIEEEKEWCIGLQNLSFPRDKYLVSRMIVEENKIIFGLYNTGIILSYLLDTKEFRKVCSLKENFKIDKAISKYANNIYLSAVNCNEIYRVNLEDNTQERISIGFWKKDNSVINAFLCGADIYLLPKYDNEIVKYDVTNQELGKMNWEVPKLAEGDPGRWFLYGYLEGQDLILYLYKYGSRVKIDLKTGRTILEHLDKDTKKSAFEILKHDYWEQLEGEQVESYREDICPLSVYINREFILSPNSADIKSNHGSKIWRTLTEE